MSLADNDVEPGGMTADVCDPILARQAVAVAAAHRPDATGHCTNLQCTGQPGPCWAARLAHHALGLACRTPTPVHPPTRPDPAVAANQTADRDEFVGWLTTAHRQPSASPTIRATARVPTAPSHPAVPPPH